MHPALFYKETKNGLLCRLCPHFCLIKEQELGFCLVRKNIGGKLFSLVYDKIAAINLDPIEKKPLYHFLPNSYCLSVGTNGCNMTCRCCQNSDLSREFRYLNGQKVEPEGIIDLAIVHDAQSIAYTYNEPTVFIEYVLDTATLAQEYGIKNILVSNGYQSLLAQKSLAPFIDAVNIDLKTFNSDKYIIHSSAKLKSILQSIVNYKKSSWLELTTLIIPGFNDNIKELSTIAQFIYSNLGSETVWHLSAFRPAYKMLSTPPTSEAFLLEAYDLAKSCGLENVYIGNAGLENHTFCPECGEILITRKHYQTEIFGTLGLCSKCERRIHGVWE